MKIQVKITIMMTRSHFKLFWGRMFSVVQILKYFLQNYSMDSKMHSIKTRQQYHMTIMSYSFVCKVSTMYAVDRCRLMHAVHCVDFVKFVKRYPSHFSFKLSRKPQENDSCQHQILVSMSLNKIIHYIAVLPDLHVKWSTTMYRNTIVHEMRMLYIK